MLLKQGCVSYDWVFRKEIWKRCEANVVLKEMLNTWTLFGKICEIHERCLESLRWGKLSITKMDEDWLMIDRGGSRIRPKNRRGSLERGRKYKSNAAYLVSRLTSAQPCFRQKLLYFWLKKQKAIVCMGGRMNWIDWQRDRRKHRHTFL